jgi:hypothetical protein
MKKAIFLYDFTGLMAQPWLDAGYECWLFDGQHESGVKRDGNLVKVGMWFHHDQIHQHAAEIAGMVGSGVEMVFGFPECTDLTVAGAKHWMKKRDVNSRFQVEAFDLAMLVCVVGQCCNSKWAFENPIGALSTLYRKPDFLFHPCDFGGHLPEGDIHPVYPQIYPGRDAYNKRTCIWSGGGFIEPGRKRIEPLSKDNPGWKLCGGKSLKTKNIRSATPRGFAIAVYEANHD